MRVEKIKISDGGGLRGRAMHNFREFDKSAEITEFADKENQFIGAKNYNQLISMARKKWDTVTKKRSDSVGMLEVIITTTANALPKDKEKSFFQESLKELYKWYGKENILSMAIHNDETTPHAHFFIVPIEQKIVAKNRLNKAEKEEFAKTEKRPTKTEIVLNAQKVTGGRNVLRGLQNDLYKNVFKKFNLKRGEIHDKPKKNQRSTLAHKEKELNEREEALNQRELLLDAKEKIYKRIDKAIKDNTINEKNSLSAYQMVKRALLKNQLSKVDNLQIDKPKSKKRK